MALVFYYVMFAISLVFAIFYAFIFHKHYDASLTIMVVLVPIINLGFVLMGDAKEVGEALIALRLTYLGGCFLIVVVLFLIYNICGVKIHPIIRMIIIAISSAVYATTLTIGHTDLFYAGTPYLSYFGGAAYIDGKTYGPMHAVFYVMVGLYYAATLGVIVYSFFKKKQVPRMILVFMVLAVTIALFGFLGGRKITNSIELLPACYNIGMVFYVIIADRIRLYDASESVIDALVQKGETGFVSLDNKLRYLGSNDTAKVMFPELASLIVDYPASKNEWLKDNVLSILDEYSKDESKDKYLINKDNKTYLIHFNRLLIGKRKRGYQLFITDDTKNQEYIKLIQEYNKQLEEEVAKKTAHIVEMHEKLVLAMATMVEGRDNSTGGHIKRTSDGVRILVEQMRKINFLNLSEKFYNDIIRAAPMHDLGKITVDDAVLRKPGRFTPEEFEMMKTHAEQGARIVKQILEGTDDSDFTKIAINVAHYHHERWDGSGYPTGLKGKAIPLEARIMAIADVYDALVSKRVYKESMTFEEADRIIMEGMGKHFDPTLQDIYVKARPELEKYYSSNVFDIQ